VTEARESIPSILSTPQRREPALQMGLRVQIVLALSGLTLLAFVPLFFAVASLTRATVIAAREEAARDVSAQIAASLAELPAADPRAIAHALELHARGAGIRAACAFGAEGARLACAGVEHDAAALFVAAAPAPGKARMLRTPRGVAIEVETPYPGGALVARYDLADDAGRAMPLVRLVALYMGVFALALGVFAYLALTRLIVRPVEDLVAAADRVASGARTLRAPRTGARELLDLGNSVRSMAEKLIAEEAALLLKIEELTETTTRLTETQAQLVRSERLASVGRLAAGLAHEIGNPLAALIGMQDLLLDGDLPPEAQRDFVQRMRRETERIHAVVRDLLDFARPEGHGASSQTAGAGGTEGGTEADARRSADVRAVADDVAALVRAQKDFRGVRVETDAPEGLRVALAGQHLTQVLLNVVLNAGSAIGAAGRTEGRVTIRARDLGGGRVRIEVEDDGPGVDPAVRDRLFEPFVTTKEIGEGTGLGLAVCRGLVESAGGEIGLDPACTAGARFYVVLPAGSAGGRAANQ
jgi:two-component system, NtrC family, sensor kinase